MGGLCVVTERPVYQGDCILIALQHDLQQLE